MKNKKANIIVIIFLFGFLIRFAAYIMTGRLAHPQFWEYHDIAENFLLGKGLMCLFLDVPSYAYAEPLYPLLSAAVYFITNHNYAIFGLVNILASSFIMIAVYYLGKQLFDERAGLAAAFLTAIHPGLVYFATEFHPLTFNTLFMVLVISTLMRLFKTLKIRDAVFSGVLIGLAFLDRFSCLIFTPIAVGFLIFSNTSVRLKLKLSIIIILITLVPVTAWSARNYVLFHKLVIMRSSTGYLFWLSNNPHSTGSAQYDRNNGILNTLGDQTLKRLNTMDELGINSYLMERAVSFVKSDPRMFLWNWIKRFYYFWWFSPTSGILYPASWFILYRAFYALVLITAAYAFISIILSRKTIKNVYWPGIYLIAISVLSLAATQSLFYIAGRHRWVIEPIIMIFSSWTIVHLLRSGRKAGLDDGKINGMR